MPNTHDSSRSAGYFASNDNGDTSLNRRIHEARTELARYSSIIGAAISRGDTISAQRYALEAVEYANSFNVHITELLDKLVDSVSAELMSIKTQIDYSRPHND